ncbi:MAG: branched-chain amino acid ABC transporter [Rhodospirillaceae bacterium]|jgi:branched-chain amino acid transport system permease protein|nr:branched-chain amino acid ABC transporter [Rhodospirillaceae bacterium]
MTEFLISDLSNRGRAALALFVIILASLPFWSSSYAMSVATITLYLAIVGQSWNLMLGFAGLLSIGHALFVGVSAYAAAYLFSSFGLPPVVGVFPAVALAIIVGMFIGYLGFRFSIGGVYFALLTIAFAELVRISVDHMGFIGGTEGLFLQVSESDRQGFDLINLRGHPFMFYYLAMALTFITLGGCRYLLKSKLGYYWQAIRDDQDAAQALGINVFKYKMYAVVYSSGIAGVAGVFYAFYQNSLFPESVFGIERSIEITLGPIVGGVGSLFGPVLGAFILTPLGEGLTELIDFLKDTEVIDPKLKLNGLKLLIWGLVVSMIVLFKPTGIWPWLNEKLGFSRKEGD